MLAHFCNGIKSEWKKIVWTPRRTLIKQIIGVAVVSIIIAAIIVAVDRGALALTAFFTGIGS